MKHTLHELSKEQYEIILKQSLLTSLSQEEQITFQQFEHKTSFTVHLKYTMSIPKHPEYIVKSFSYEALTYFRQLHNLSSEYICEEIANGTFTNDSSIPLVSQSKLFCIQIIDKKQTSFLLKNLEMLMKHFFTHQYTFISMPFLINKVFIGKKEIYYMLTQHIPIPLQSIVYLMHNELISKTDIINYGVHLNYLHQQTNNDLNGNVVINLSREKRMRIIDIFNSDIDFLNMLKYNDYYIEILVQNNIEKQHKESASKKHGKEKKSHDSKHQKKEKEKLKEDENEIQVAFVSKMMKEKSTGIHLHQKVNFSKPHELIFPHFTEHEDIVNQNVYYFMIQLFTKESINKRRVCFFSLFLFHCFVVIEE